MENCFGRLKGQWRRLKFIDADSPERIENIIEACLLLHNFGLRHGVPYDGDNDDDINDPEDDNLPTWSLTSSVSESAKELRDRLAQSLV